MLKLKTTATYDEQYLSWIRSGQLKTLDRIDALVSAALTNPVTGIGKPELLKGDLAGKWSRRINQKDRFIYSVDGDFLIAEQCRGHYDNK